MREPDPRNDLLSRWLRLKTRQPAKGLQLACLGLILIGLLLAIAGWFAVNASARPLLPCGLAIGVIGAVLFRRTRQRISSPLHARQGSAAPDAMSPHGMPGAESESFAGPLPAGEPVALYSLAGWPLMTLTPPDGGLAVMGLDRGTGVLVPRYDLFARVRDGSADLDRLDMPAFRALLRTWRDRLMQAHSAQTKVWTRTGNGEFPLRGEIGDRPALVRVNDFPAEPLYSVIIDGQNVGNLEDWPATWTKADDGV